MDIIDKKYKAKRFFKTIYRGLEPGEYIRVFQNNKTNSNEGNYSKVTYFNNIDELTEHSNNKYIKSNNTYFELATTDGTGGAIENLKYRYCLGFDFDKKDLGSAFNHKDIVNLFKGLKIYCHCIVDSGNGYHSYIIINKTSDIEKVNAVQKALCDKLGADKNAIKPTQTLRIPYTFNIKNEPKMVNIVHLADRNSEKFKPYDIDFLYQKNCINRAVKPIGAKVTAYTLGATTIQPCIEEILINGSKENDRYKDLQNIIVSLRLRNRSLTEIKAIIKEWDIKSNFNDNTEYRAEHIYNNKRGLELNCNGCKNFNNCNNRVISDFEYIKGEEVITVYDKNAKDLKSKKRGAKTMKGNDLFIYNVLANNIGKELTREEITELITEKKRKKIVRVAMSDKTLRDTLKSLVDNGYIEVIRGIKKLGISDKYKLNEVRATADKQFTMSYFCILAVIWGKISTEELRLYTHMRYKQHLEQLEGKAKGNIFRINQTDLAKDLDLTQQRISDMIENLIDKKILDIWEIKTNDNGFKYYTYRLNK